MNKPTSRRTNQNQAKQKNSPSDPRYIDLAPAPLLERPASPPAAAAVAAAAAAPAVAAAAVKRASPGAASPAAPAALAPSPEARERGVDSVGDATKLLPSRSMSCITEMAFSDVGPDHGKPPACVRTVIGECERVFGDLNHTV